MSEIITNFIVLVIPVHSRAVQWWTQPVKRRPCALEYSQPSICNVKWTGFIWLTSADATVLVKRYSSNLHCSTLIVRMRPARQDRPAGGQRRVWVWDLPKSLQLTQRETRIAASVPLQIKNVCDIYLCEYPYRKYSLLSGLIKRFHSIRCLYRV